MNPKGPWGNCVDTDEDLLPDIYELWITGTRPDNPDSCIIRDYIRSGYSDEELEARRAELGITGVAANDWACPGKQSGSACATPITSRSNSPAAIAIPFVDSIRSASSAEWYSVTAPQENSDTASLTGQFWDEGVDLDGDRLYDSLKLRVGVQVSKTETLHVRATLKDALGIPLISAQTTSTFEPGTNAIDLLFDGHELWRSGKQGPYTIATVELALRAREPYLAQVLRDAYTTTSYRATDFDPYDILFSGSYADRGRDTSGDGQYNFLDMNIGLNVQRTGTYTVTGDLYRES